MISRFHAWLNSMQAYMIGFAFSVVIVLTLVSVITVEFAGPPRRGPVSIYDLARVIRGEDTARAGLAREFEKSVSATVSIPTTQVERDLSKILSDDLSIPADSVRIYIGNRSIRYLDYVDRQLASYNRDGKTSPLISGTVIAAVRGPDGHWRVFARESADGFLDVWLLLSASPWLGGLVLIPFSMWFSTRIARPVRAFAQAVSRVGDNRQQFPVPVVGPNETRVAAIALNEMQARIRDFLRERTTLVGAIAHDLRTPLNNLRFRIAGAPDQVRRAAEADILQLNQLINSILDYVENDGKVLSLDAIDLTSLLQSLVDDNTDSGRIISLTGDHARIDGDIVMLRRLFSNLITNAFNFAEVVTITIFTSKSHAIVQILDNGPGMSSSDLQQACEPFFRGERSRNRETGGIGLGLAIASSVAEAHLGTLELKNAAGGGLLAIVSLPVKQPNGSVGLCQKDVAGRAVAA